LEKKTGEQGGVCGSKEAEGWGKGNSGEGGEPRALRVNARRFVLTVEKGRILCDRGITTKRRTLVVMEREEMRDGSVEEGKWSGVRRK